MSSHFDGKRFFNPNGAKAKGLRDVLRWQLSKKSTPWPDWIDDVQETKPASLVGAGELAATLINHSSVLLQTAGVNLLFDPVWSERASPVAFAGPKRRRAPGVRFEDLPKIDAVLLSHNHYDHLDLPTLRRLRDRDRPEFLTPVGVGTVLRRNGMAAEEADWWDRRAVAGLEVECLPAQHFSARGITDRDQTLWCGYGLRTDVGFVYFAGDSGFGEHFAEIRKRCGVPRLALLPIGAYLPRWFMGPVHMSPKEAAQVHGILEAELSVAIHQGTFALADEGPEDAVRELQETGVERFVTLNNGESVRLRGDSGAE